MNADNLSLDALYRENKSFFLFFILFVILSAAFLLSHSKQDGFFTLNIYHSQPLTWFFIYATYLGDGLFSIAVGVVLFLLKKRLLGLMVVAAYALSGIIAQVLKYFVVQPRPAILFEDTDYQYFIENVTLHNLHAFPSGHTSSAFALAAILSFAAKNKSCSIIFLTAAIIVGYSRIYLAQHFLDDVLAGAVIGVVSSIICFLFLYRLFSERKSKN